MIFNDVNAIINFIETSKRFTAKTSLDKIEFLCSLFDHPENKFQSIHITGTNGKGSVVSYLASVFTEAGLKVATFTSPYIVCFNERITFDGQMIRDDDILRLGNLIISKYDEIKTAGFEDPTFFELITLMAFLYFSEQDNLDIALIEVGIGGRLDSTNVITPLISIITNIGLDHMHVLGSTLPEILDNKLGIVKPEVPLVTGITDLNLKAQALKYCNEIASPCYFIDPSDVEIQEASIFCNHFSTSIIKDIKLYLPGFHQIDNALVAIQVIKTFNQGVFRKLKKSILPISDVILKRGLAATKWPGRLEVISSSPLVVVDGGHNVDGINRVVQFVTSLPYKSKRCIFACSDDKDKEAMIKILEPAFDEIIFTAFNYKRHSDARYLFELSNHNNKKLDFDLNHIITSVWEKPAELNLFIGSLYFVSEMRPLLIDKAKSN